MLQVNRVFVPSGLETARAPIGPLMPTKTPILALRASLGAVS